MKILIIDNAAIANVNNDYCVYKSTGEFGLELLQLKNEVEYFQFNKDAKSTISNFDLRKHGMKVSTLKTSRFKLLTYLQAYFKGFLRILNNDFTYVFYPNTFSYILLLTRLFNKRYGLYIRGEEGIENRVSNILYKYADVIFTVSDTFTNRINNSLPKKVAHTIRPMISFNKGDIIKNRSYADRDNFRILYLGRIDRDKGIFELLEAVKILSETSLIKFHIDIVGSGPNIEQVKRRAEELNISPYVNFLGAFYDRQKIIDKYLKSDIYILPTYHEGFPRTLYEAMIFGTPIITTFVGGIPGLMKDGFNCLKIDTKSASSIVQKLIYAMENYVIFDTIASNATLTIENFLAKKELSHAAHLNSILNYN